jgi:copper chaperone CopZ
MKVYKIITFFFFVAVNHYAQSQIVAAQINVLGLTCSMCSYSVEKALLKNDFVDSVHMDLNQNRCQVFFNSNQNINIKELIQAVYNAGFSIGDLTFYMNNIQNYCKNDSRLEISTIPFYILNPSFDCEKVSYTQAQLIHPKTCPKKYYRLFKNSIQKTLNEESKKPYYYIILKP